MTVRVEHDGPVTTVILSRPAARNAVDGPTAAALAEAFRSFDQDDSAAVAVLWGEGGNFCAGADLKAIGTANGNRLALDGDGPMGPTRMVLSKPVIAAVDGYAVAGGLELALWCDLRVAADDAVFGVFCRRWGVPLVDGGTFRLPRLIGTSRAMDLILTGRAVTAAEALEIGLINRVVPSTFPQPAPAAQPLPAPGSPPAAQPLPAPDSLPTALPLAAPGSLPTALPLAAGGSLPAARRLAAEIAALPQTCLRHDRLSLLEQHGLTEAEAMANEHRHGLVSIADVASGLTRFAAGEGRHGT